MLPLTWRLWYEGVDVGAGWAAGQAQHVPQQQTGFGHPRPSSVSVMLPRHSLTAMAAGVMVFSCVSCGNVCVLPSENELLSCQEAEDELRECVSHGCLAQLNARCAPSHD